MWKNFDRKAYTQDEFRAYADSLTWTSWKPQGITLHNTSAPTLAQWVESGPKHDQRILNLQSYYEGMGWHAGPHLFVSRNFINGFSNILEPGVHSTCYNRTHLGIEMVGEYNVEEFDSGDGERVRNNAVWAMAVLCRKLKLDPTQLTFHVDCKRDNHDCPGKKVHRSDVIKRVQAQMAVFNAGPLSSTPGPQPTVTPPIPPPLPPFTPSSATPIVQAVIKSATPPAHKQEPPMPTATPPVTPMVTATTTSTPATLTAPAKTTVALTMPKIDFLQIEKFLESAATVLPMIAMFVPQARAVIPFIPVLEGLLKAADQIEHATSADQIIEIITSQLNSISAQLKATKTQQ